MSKSIEECLIKAVKDPNFKAEFKKNPKKILENECGISLPENCQVTLLEQSKDRNYIIIPKSDNLKKYVEEAEKNHYPEAEFFKKLTDPQFKDRLKKDPRKCLQECGISAPSEGTIECVEEDDNQRYLVLPESFNVNELSDQQITLIQGGKSAPFYRVYDIVKSWF